MKKIVHFVVCVMALVWMSIPVYAVSGQGLVKADNGRYRYIENGTYVKEDWRSADGSDYYFNAKGYSVIGKKTIDNALYYFDADSRLVKNRHGYQIKNAYFQISESGVCKKVGTTLGMAGIAYDKAGGTIWKAFKYCAVTIK